MIREARISLYMGHMLLMLLAFSFLNFFLLLDMRFNDNKITVY
jgi:hypothetical protein